MKYAGVARRGSGVRFDVDPVTGTSANDVHFNSAARIRRATFVWRAARRIRLTRNPSSPNRLGLRPRRHRRSPTARRARACSAHRCHVRIHPLARAACVADYWDCVFSRRPQQHRRHQISRDYRRTQASVSRKIHGLAGPAAEPDFVPARRPEIGRAHV